MTDKQKIEIFRKWLVRGTFMDIEIQKYIWDSYLEFLKNENA